MTKITPAPHSVATVWVGADSALRSRAALCSVVHATARHLSHIRCSPVSFFVARRMRRLRRRIDLRPVRSCLCLIPSTVDSGAHLASLGAHFPARVWPSGTRVLPSGTRVCRDSWDRIQDNRHRRARRRVRPARRRAPLQPAVQVPQEAVPHDQGETATLASGPRPLPFPPAVGAVASPASGGRGEARGANRLPKTVAISPPPPSVLLTLPSLALPDQLGTQKRGLGFGHTQRARQHASPATLTHACWKGSPTVRQGSPTVRQGSPTVRQGSPTVRVGSADAYQEMPVGESSRG
eukprot:gene18265-biopygen14475